jgi:hypothetical protein
MIFLNIRITDKIFSRTCNSINKILLVKIQSVIKSVFFNIHFLLFFNGFLIALFLFCIIQADYENRVFTNIAKKINSGKESESQDDLIKKAVSTTYYLLESRAEIFNNAPAGGFLDQVIYPVSNDLMTAEGACGSYAAVLCRVLNTMGFATRFAQMKVDGLYGGHIIAEVKTRNGWIVLDPIYNLSFTRPDGQLASFNDVSANWQWYKSQVPAGYKQNYNYAGVCYTNWNKIPVLMPALKKILSLFLKEEEVQQISLRNYFLKKYSVCASILLSLILPLSFLIIAKMIKFKFYHTIPLPGFLEQRNKELAAHANA